MNRFGSAALITLLAVIPGACAANTGSSVYSGNEPVAAQSSLAPASSTAAASPETPPSPQPPPSTAEAALRGLYSPLAFWDHTFTAASPADCAAEGEYSGDYITTDHAWRLPGGALACIADSNGVPINTLDLFFDPNVDAQKALATVSSILPADSQQVGSSVHANPTSSKYPQGSCRQMLFSSDTLEAAINQNPQSAMDPYNEVFVAMYSGNATEHDGADQPYQPESVHLASIFQGDDKVGNMRVGC